MLSPLWFWKNRGKHRSFIRVFSKSVSSQHYHRTRAPNSIPKIKKGVEWGEILVDDYRNAASLLSRMSEQILQERSAKATYKWKMKLVVAA